MELLDFPMETEAISPGNSLVETQNSPEFEPGSANDLPKSPSAEEPRDGRSEETNDDPGPTTTDDQAESTNAEKESGTDDEDANARPQLGRGDDLQGAAVAGEAELTAGDAPPDEIEVQPEPVADASQNPTEVLKLISTARLEANIRNSKFSTGPKTERGKSFSRRNPIKHGILISEALIEGEDRTRLEQLRLELFLDCAPVGALEEMVVADIATCYWRGERALRCEQGSAVTEEANRMPQDELPEQQRQAIKAQLSLPFGENLDRILRYAPTFHRQLLANIAALERLQKARKAREKEARIV